MNEGTVHSETGLQQLICIAIRFIYLMKALEAVLLAHGLHVCVLPSLPVPLSGP